MTISQLIEVFDVQVAAHTIKNKNKNKVEKIFVKK